MGFEMDAPESMDTGANFLEQPGWYHLSVGNIDQQPTNREGMPIDALKVNCHVLDGEHKEQKGKSFGMMLFHPKMSDKNNGEFAKKRIARFFDSVCVGTVSNGRISVTDDEMDAAGGRQFVAKVKKSDNSDYMELSFADIYHVDDEAVKAVPKDQAALDLLPANLRRTGAATKPKQEAAAKPAASAAASPVDLDDI